MSPNRFLITDTNNDTKPDIVHFNGGNKGVSVFIGDGLGNFGTKRKDTYADWTGLTTINPDPTTHRLADILNVHERWLRLAVVEEPSNSSFCRKFRVKTLVRGSHYHELFHNRPDY